MPHIIEILTSCDFYFILNISYFRSKILRFNIILRKRAGSCYFTIFKYQYKMYICLNSTFCIMLYSNKLQINNSHVIWYLLFLLYYHDRLFLRKAICPYNFPYQWHLKTSEIRQGIPTTNDI